MDDPTITKELRSITGKNSFERERVVGELSPADRDGIRAEIEGLIATLYGLNADEFDYILSTFPQVSPRQKEAAKREFCKLQLSQEGAISQSPLQRYLEGESDSVEYKSSLLVALEFDAAEWEGKGLSPQLVQQKRSDSEKAVTHSVLKTICAFINTDGGDLLIGVKDDATVIGLEPDFARDKKKPNADGFELTLRQLIDSRIEPTPHGLVKITWVKVEGNDVCHVRVEKSLDPHHVDKEEVYIRDGNRTVQLKGIELTNWMRKRLGASD